MNNTYEFKPLEFIVLMAGIFTLCFFFVFVVCKLFKKCCLYSYEHGFKMFSLLNCIIFAIPFVTVALRHELNLAWLNNIIIVVLFVLFTGVPLVVNIIKMGFFYGIGISAFRIIVGSFGLLFVGSVAALGVVFAIVILFGLEDYFRKASVLIDFDGNIIVLHHLENNQYGDFDGNIFYDNGDGTMYSTDGSVYFIHRDD